MLTCELKVKYNEENLSYRQNLLDREVSQVLSSFFPCSGLHREVSAFQFQEDNGIREGTRTMTGRPNQPLSPSYPMYNRTPFQAAPRIKHWLFYNTK